MGRRLTPRELDVIGAVWRRGSGTVAEVREDLEDELAYTTVLTVLRGLEQKGYLRHEEEGRAHRFYPEVEPEEAAGGLLERLIDKVYQGSPVELVTHLVSERDLTRAELDELRAVLDGAAEIGPTRGRGEKSGGGD